MAVIYGITVDQLVSWNPSLSADDCRLSPGSRYCFLRRADDATTAPYTDGDICLEVKDILPGTIDTCSCFTEVRGGDDEECECSIE
jgi:hypothetical protein